MTSIDIPPAFAKQFSPKVTAVFPDLQRHADGAVSPQQIQPVRPASNPDISGQKIDTLLMGCCSKPPRLRAR
jgi:hypothetical protein